MSLIDINFNVTSDTPKGKDPDSYSPTLRMYHKILWSKHLPNGMKFDMDVNTPRLLHHKSELGEFFLSSDSIGHTYKYVKKMSPIIDQVTHEEMDSVFSICTTVGAYIIFPSKKINNKMTINASRGVNHKIQDRFDITLECIRRLYLKENSFKMNNTSINILPSLNFSLFDELKKIIFYFPKLSLFLKSIKYSSINFSDPYYFQEGVKEDRYLCESSINLINRVDWGAISCQRRGLWVEWEEFAKSHGLSPVFKEVWPESTPWSFPVFTKNVEQRNEWIKWGVKYKVLLFSWPALPTLEIEKKSSAFKKWERVLCFPLDGLSPEDLCDAAKNTTI